MSTRSSRRWPIFYVRLEPVSRFHPNFEDGLEVERVLSAVEASAQSNGVFTRSA